MNNRKNSSQSPYKVIIGKKRLRGRIKTCTMKVWWGDLPTHRMHCHLWVQNSGKSNVLRVSSTRKWGGRTREGIQNQRTSRVGNVKGTQEQTNTTSCFGRNNRYIREVLKVKKKWKEKKKLLRNWHILKTGTKSQHVANRGFFRRNTRAVEQQTLQTRIQEHFPEMKI